jgi:hypothetical protein
VSFVTSAFIVTWVALLLLALALAGVVRQLRHLSGPDAGVRRSAAALPRPNIRLPSIATGVPLVLLLVDRSCRVCADRLEDLQRWSKVHDDAIAFAVASRDTLAHADDGVTVTVHEHADGIFDTVEPRMLPFGVVFDPDGQAIAGGAVGSAQRLAQLIAAATDHVKVVATP